MEQQVAVMDLIESTLGIEEANVPLELFTVTEGVGELVNDLLLLVSETVRIFWIYGREVAVFHRIHFTIDGDSLMDYIDLVQQKAIFHSKFGSAKNLLTFQFEKDDGDGFIHPGGEELVLFAVLSHLGVGQFDMERGKISILIDFVGENRQGPQGNAVTGLDDLQIVIVNGIRKHSGNQCAGTGGGTHPQNVVVAPLNVHTVHVEQAVQDNICPGTTVKNISHNVQMIYSQLLDHMADRLNHFCCLTNLDNGGDHALIVISLIGFIVTNMEKFVNDKLVILRHGRANLVAGIFNRYKTTDLHQPVQGNAIPFIQIVDFISNQGQFFSRIVNQSRQIIPIPLGEGVAEKFIEFFLYFTGAGVDNMGKGFMLSVNVRDKVFGALG